MKTSTAVIVDLAAQGACASEMNGFMFFKSKSDPTILFQNPIQIQKLTVLKSKSC